MLSLTSTIINVHLKIESMDGFLKDIFDFFFNPLDIIVTLIFLLLLAIVAQIMILIFYKKVSGKVTKSYVDEKAGKKKNKYRPMIHYSYLYSGNEFSGVSGGVINESRSDQSWAQRIINENPVGKAITILVNPIFPSHSALPHDIRPFHWAIIMIIIFLSIIVWILMNSGYTL